MDGKKYYSSITEILDDMHGANWMITEEQVKGIRALLETMRKGYRQRMHKVLIDAYEAGRKHDLSAFKEMESEIMSGGRDSDLF